jgi:hypothetical protein
MRTLFPQISTLFRGVPDKSGFPTVLAAFSQEKRTCQNCVSQNRKQDQVADERQSGGGLNCIRCLKCGRWTPQAVGDCGKMNAKFLAGRLLMNLILLTCVFFTFAMTGLIWLIQMVNYPLMSLVPPDDFPAYEASHCRRISPVVLPLMTGELVTSGWLTFRPIATVESELLVGAILTFLLWASTFLIQVPLHHQLEKAFNPQAWKRLVLTNWIRTTLWSVRSILMGWIVWQVTVR